MRQDRYQKIQTLLTSYRTAGAKRYRRRQYRRMIAIINDILANEPACLNDPMSIGRRQVIGYWRRHEHESDKVRREKWNALKVLFEVLDKAEPPEPRKKQS